MDGNGAFDAAVDTWQATTTTDASGKYAFTGLAPGRYLVVEDAGGPDGNWTPVGDWWQAVNIDCSGEKAGVDFLNEMEACYEGLTPGFWKQSQNWRKVSLDPACADDADGPFYSFTRFADIVEAARRPLDPGRRRGGRLRPRACRSRRGCRRSRRRSGDAARRSRPPGPPGPGR